MDNYIEINKKSWNSRVDTHVASEFYDMVNFLNGKNSLKSIELNLLGDLKGKKVLHLQCHFGQDSISLARMGAEVVGVDLSDKAIDKRLASKGLSKPSRGYWRTHTPMHDDDFDIIVKYYTVL